MKILYATQTKTAERFAYDLKREAKAHGFHASVVDCKDYNCNDLQNESLVIYCVSTYGEGDAPDSCNDFYRWLISEERNEGELNNMQYAVFALGDSQYQYFCQIGKIFDQTLEKLGGVRLMEMGISDAFQASPEDQFAEWKKKLWPLLCQTYLGKDLNESSIDQNIECAIKIEIINKDFESECIIASNLKYPFDLSHKDNPIIEKDKLHLFQPFRRAAHFDNMICAPLIEKNELRPSTIDGSTLHCSFDIKNEFNYRTADNLGIIVRNDYKIVDQLCERLNLNKKDIIYISSKDETQPLELHIPKIISIQNLFLWYLDIAAMPTKTCISTLSQFAQNNDDKEELQKLSKTGIPANEHMTLLQLLLKYPSINIDLANIIELLRPLQPRLYTISSSSCVHPEKVSITFKLEEEFGSHSSSNENNEPDFIGVCSQYMKNSAINDVFHIFYQQSSFKLPSMNIPIIMIGIGAGIAPFIGFIEEGNNAISKQNNKEEEFGNWWLFFGCRSKNIDYIYKDFLEKSLKQNGGCLEELKLAFSRDNESKVYVQHLIEAHSEELYELISIKKAKIYVCGGVKMGKDVRNTFVKIFERYNKEEKGGEAYLNDMLKHNQYVQELWG